MKKNTRKILITVLFIAAIIIFLNIDVTTRQGINYQVRTIHIPLYLKALDFVDRHYNYKQLVKDITRGSANKEESILKIFRWVNTNIRRMPPELPVVDDHPLSIIIRGYGAEDQFEDVFTILCTYAAQEAFYEEFKNSHGSAYLISFVRIGKRWFPFSTYSGAYARKGADLASMDDIMSNPALLAPFTSSVPDFETETFLAKARKMKFDANSMRTRGQSPFGRAVYYLTNIGRVEDALKQKSKITKTVNGGNRTWQE